MTRDTGKVERLITRLERRSIETQTGVPYDGKHLLPGRLVDSPDIDMSVLDAIITRRTVRSYEPEPVPFEIFERLINITTHAPSACNEQNWKVIYIDDSSILRDLYLRGAAEFLKNSRQAFIIVYDNRTDNREYWDHVQSAAAFINTFTLVAHSVGIGTCWVAHLPLRREMKRIFGIDKCYDPIALVSFGYYRKGTKLLPRRREAARIISKNSFRFSESVAGSARSHFSRRILRRFYYLSPPFLRKKMRRFTLPHEKKFYNNDSSPM